MRCRLLFASSLVVGIALAGCAPHVPPTGSTPPGLDETKGAPITYQGKNDNKDEAESRRKEQVAKVCAQYGTDKAKLDQLLAQDDEVVPARQKDAYRQEFLRAYGAWQNEIQACVRDAAARAEWERVLGRMVPIPAGTFKFGDEKTISVPAFQMDATEVTLAAYEACVRANGCSGKVTGEGCNWGTGRKNHPMNCVDWNQATAFCRWAGKRLPTEEEWEYGARGADGRTYPWGNSAPGKQLCWDGEGSDVGKGNRQSTCPVGSYPSGDSPFGLHDMAGNAWEWTSSYYGAHTRVDRGGSWGSIAPDNVRAALRNNNSTATRHGTVGFRCARWRIP